MARKRMELTARQSEVLAFVRSRPRMPSTWAIAARFGMHSTLAAAGHLRALDGMGLLGKPAAPRVTPPAGVELRHRQIISGARERGIAVSITLEEYTAKLSSGACGYCGGPLASSGSALDRRDPSQGYSEVNTTACCFPCNTGKGKLTAAQWMRVIEPALERYGAGNVWPREASPVDGVRGERDEAKGAWAVARMVYALGGWAGASRIPRTNTFKGRKRRNSSDDVEQPIPLGQPVNLVRGIIEELARLAAVR